MESTTSCRSKEENQKQFDWLWTLPWAVDSGERHPCWTLLSVLLGVSTLQSQYFTEYFRLTPDASADCWNPCSCRLWRQRHPRGMRHWCQGSLRWGWRFVGPGNATADRVHRGTDASLCGDRVLENIDHQYISVAPVIICVYWNC